MGDPLLIRPATEADAAAVALLSTELGYPAAAGVMRDRLRAILGSGADLVLAAAGADGRVVGWLQAHAAHKVESGFVVDIVGLVVDPEVRRRGVGRSLVEAAERWAATRSAGTVVVRSNLRRVESHLFYPALGYERAKEQAVYRKGLPGPT